MKGPVNPVMSWTRFRRYVATSWTTCRSRSTLNTISAATMTRSANVVSTRRQNLMAIATAMATRKAIACSFPECRRWVGMTPSGLSVVMT